MIYAPVIIPTLNRFEHLRNCLESLAQCTWADRTEVFISLDYPPQNAWEKYCSGWEQSRDWLHSIGDFGFKKIYLFEQTGNLGVAFGKKGVITNYDFLVQKVSKTYDRYILTEDDNVFSPCFLQYMDQALEKFKDEKLVFSVSGFNGEGFKSLNGASVLLCPNNSAFGTGYWVNKVERFNRQYPNPAFFNRVLKSPLRGYKLRKTFPALYAMLNSMITKQLGWWDTMHTTVNILEGTFQMRPLISLVRNEGDDGTGEHCGSEKVGHLLEISSDTMFFFPNTYSPFNVKTNKEVLFSLCLDSTKEGRVRDLRSIRSIYRHNVFPLYYKLKRLFL